MTSGWWDDLSGLGDVAEVATEGWWSGVSGKVAHYINPYPYIFHGRPGLK